MTPSSPLPFSPFRRGRLSAFLRMARRRMQPSPLRFQTSASVLDHYVSGLPTTQSAVDSVPGWIGAMPPEAGCVAGLAPVFADPRIAALLAAYDCNGRSVLELGPFEGFRTYRLHQAGAAMIDAIETNALAFVRCLVTKEVLKLDHATFHLGDYTRWVAQTQRSFDLIVACDVLDRESDPVALLESIAARCGSVFLATHCLHDEAIPNGTSTEMHHGISVRLRRQDVDRPDGQGDGGGHRSVRIARGDILALLGALGFNRIVVLEDQPDHLDGPAFAVLAERTIVSGDTRAAS